MSKFGSWIFNTSAYTLPSVMNNMTNSKLFNTYQTAQCVKFLSIRNDGRMQKQPQRLSKLLASQSWMIMPTIMYFVNIVGSPFCSPTPGGLVRVKILLTLWQHWPSSSTAIVLENGASAVSVSLQKPSVYQRVVSPLYAVLHEEIAPLLWACCI